MIRSRVCDCWIFCAPFLVEQFFFLMFSIPKCYINTTCQSITQHFILYTIKIVYCQGDMCRALLGHLQALWENRSKRTWRWPNKGRNISPWQYTIFNVYKIKCCVIDWHVVFIRTLFFVWGVLHTQDVSGTDCTPDLHFHFLPPTRMLRNWKKINFAFKIKTSIFSQLHYRTVVSCTWQTSCRNIVSW